MLFYKIYLLQPYDTEDEIGNRPLIRCFQKTGVGTLVEDCYPFIVAYVDESLFIRELFTGQLLKRSNICNKPFFGKEDNLRFNDLSRFKSESISSKEELYSLLSLKRNKDFVNAITTAIFNIPNEFELSQLNYNILKTQLVQDYNCSSSNSNYYKCIKN